jgi:ribose-phosphate pyrophosphokinase
MERATRPGEVVTAKTRARLFSAIPVAPFGNELTLLDLHTEGLPFYFEGPLRTRHLYAKPLILEAARQFGGERFLLGCTDAGRAKWVESLANDLGQGACFVFKQRAADGALRVTGVNANVTGQRVVIYDDMIRSGGSVIQAARAYLDAGASGVDVVATHGLFTADGLEKLRSSGLIGQIACTDSHPGSHRFKSDPFFRTLELKGLLANVLTADWRTDTGSVK